MRDWMRNLWLHLPFAGRLLVTASVALLSAGLVMVGVAARLEAVDTQNDLRQTLAQELDTLPEALSEVVVVGDFSTLKQTLDNYVARPFIVEVHFADIKGITLISRDPPRDSIAPDWFWSLFGFQVLQGTASVAVGGREYGQLSLTVSPRRLADRVWLSLLRHMAILLLAVMMDFVGIWLVLRSGLRPLQRLEEATAALARGDFSARLEVAGSPELRRLIECFNFMAEAIQISETNMRISEERLQLAINGVNDGIWDWDLRSNAIYFSPKWCQMIGYSVDELPGNLETFRSLLHPDDAPRVFRAIEDYFAGKTPTFAVEFRFRHKDGSWKWILGRGTVVRDEQGRPYRMAGSHTDITERKHYEEALATERQRLDSVLHGTNAGSWEWNVQTGETTFNERWAEIIGYTLAEISPTTIETWMRFAHPDDLKLSGELLAQHFAGKLDYYDCEARVRHKDGHWVWVLDRGKLVSRTADGKPLLMAGSHLDITARKAAEAELIQAREAAEAANRAKSAFIANMSHELRTPLNAVLGFAQLLARDPTLDNFQHGQVQSILRGGEYLLTLINDILDLAKIEAGHLELSPNTWDTGSFFRELCHMFRIRCEQKGIAFQYEQAGALPYSLYCDDKRLRQIAINLLGNAVKFTERGQVTLRVSYTGRTLRLAVEDTGIGIAQQDLSKIFEPFQQSGNGHYKAQGTGLGLTITQRLVAAMSGTLSVDSTPGQGSVFQIAVPAEAVSTVTEARADEDGPAITGYTSAAPLRILIVDDVADNREVVRALLEPLGFTVSEAGNGVECLDSLNHRTPDAIFMDLRMPEMDGLQATRALRERGYTLPVIALSASTFSNDHTASLDAGCNAHLPKPVRVAELLDTLGQLLPLAWQYAQPADSGKSGQLETLPQADAARFVHLIKMGDMTGLENFAREIAQTCPKLAGRLEQAINDFKIAELQELARHYQRDGLD